MKAYRKAALFLGVLLGGLAMPAAAQPVADSGPATLQPEANAEDENLQWAASVVVLNELRQQGDFTVKLFGLAGGDPAMNGLYTYLAFYIAPGDGWRVFKLGDFLSYRVVAESPGRVLLQVQESVMNADSVISARTRRLAVTWAPARDGGPPATVRVAAAR